MDTNNYSQEEEKWRQNGFRVRLKAKATSVVDPRKKDRDELKAQIDKLTKELKKKEKG